VAASHPGEDTEGDKSGCEKEVVEKEHSPGEQRYKQVTTRKKKRTREGAHSLEGTERETCQDEERKQTNEEHTIWSYKQKIQQTDNGNSQTGKHRMGDKSGHRKVASK
jgi:hypothetical protein